LYLQYLYTEFELYIQFHIRARSPQRALHTELVYILSYRMKFVSVASVEMDLVCNDLSHSTFI